MTPEPTAPPGAGSAFGDQHDHCAAGKRVYKKEANEAASPCA